LRRWVIQARVDRGLVVGPTSEELAEIKALRKVVADQERTIGFSERTYHARKARPLCARAVTDTALAVEIARVYDTNYRCYGARRVWLTLRREGIVVARCSVERNMTALGLHGVQRGNDASRPLPIPPPLAPLTWWPDSS
jgi:hypothetical protein